ncbi:MAG: GTPase Era [Bdellovibrionales bacterium]|nr:GTPase Era [Bdellovibrionales bacterium]
MLNQIIEEKISIVSSKPQTTRQYLSGIRSTDEYQLIFFDAPGFVNPKKGLFDFLSKEFDRVIDKSDHILFVISFEQENSDAFKQVQDKVKASGKKVSYIFSKADLKIKPFIAELRDQMMAEGAQTMTYSIKDKDNGPLFDYLKEIADQMPEEMFPLYDPEMISLDRTRDIVGELIREVCFEMLQKELPYGLGVIIKSFKNEKNMPHIEANIVVEKEGHKGIVIGKGGAQLKKIGQQSRAKIEEFLGEKVFLGLHVAYKKNWQTNKNIMKEMGYDERRQ